MNEFYEGLIAGIAMLGGFCAFNYWMFNLLEKRLEVKIDTLYAEQAEQRKEQMELRKRSDELYRIAMDLVRDFRTSRTTNQ